MCLELISDLLCHNAIFLIYATLEIFYHGEEKEMTTLSTVDSTEQCLIVHGQMNSPLEGVSICGLKAQTIDH